MNIYGKGIVSRIAVESNVNSQGKGKTLRAITLIFKLQDHPGVGHILPVIHNSAIEVGLGICHQMDPGYGC